jgi:hypothetical protein
MSNFIKATHFHPFFYLPCAFQILLAYCVLTRKHRCKWEITEFRVKFNCRSKYFSEGVGVYIAGTGQMAGKLHDNGFYRTNSRAQ